MVTFMIAILLDTPGYRIMALLHILSAIVAFGPLLLYSGLHKAGETTTIARLHMSLTFPALIALWVLGMGLAGMSEDNYKVADPWISISIVIWAVLVAVSWLMIRPAISSDSPSAASRMAAGTGISHTLLLIGLILMVWKPGA
ncbi:MAG: hypothetical protein RL058_884 [Actinomycetota bacterium]|jgi:uncharacterized membrane protein